jgi:hypothetical protein
MDPLGAAPMELDGPTVVQGGACVQSSTHRLLHCTACSQRIRGKQLRDKRKTDTGYAHRVCLINMGAQIDRQRERRAAVSPSSTVSPPLPNVPSSSNTASSRPPRAKRPYDQLKPTQKWERRRMARVTLQKIDCPINVLHPQPVASPSELIHLPKSVREQIRSVPSLHIPSEQIMIECKKQLPTTHATETGTFANGAYLTDPVRFVSVLCVQSSHLVVGGDAGGGHTKLGVTYSINDTQSFAALLVLKGSDHYDDLYSLTTPNLTPFTGDSAAFPHIFAVLQHFIDTKNAFLNGDWPFINTLLGLKNAAAIHPCPICIITKYNLLSKVPYRKPNDKRHSHNPDQPALIAIDPKRIVPTPLHLFLGISNRIILDAYKELFGEAVVMEAVQQIKTVHSVGCGGLSDLYDLNGPEISKWIKRNCSSSLLVTSNAPTPPTTDAAASIAASATVSSVSSSSPTIIASDATKATHSILSRWLKQLHHSLLHSNRWTQAEITAWRTVVADIHAHWQRETQIKPFPKLHMLAHTVEFAQRHRFLGRMSEAQIESFHAQFNAIFHKQHRNMSNNTSERLRRSLADATLRAIQPILQQ